MEDIQKRLSLAWCAFVQGKPIAISPTIRAGQNVWEYFNSLPLRPDNTPSGFIYATVEFDELLGPNDFMIRE
jgi:hypothetical protein